MIYRNIVRKLFSKVYTKEHEWLSKISDKHYQIGSKTAPNFTPYFPKSQIPTNSHKFPYFPTFSQN